MAKEVDDKKWEAGNDEMGARAWALERVKRKRERSTLYPAGKCVLCLYCCSLYHIMLLCKDIKIVLGSPPLYDTVFSTGAYYM